MNELKACPLCASKRIGQFWNDNDLYQIECRDCGCMIARKTISEAEKAWNTRAPQLPNPCTVEQWQTIESEIQGKPVKFPGMAYVWFWHRMGYYAPVQYRNIIDDDNNLKLTAPIVQAGKPEPPKDWKQE